MPHQNTASPSKPVAVSVLPKWLLTIAMTAIVAFMLLFPAAVFHRKIPSGDIAESTGPVDQLKTVAVKRLQRLRHETAAGTVKPVHESAVASRLLARVVETNVIDGQLPVSASGVFAMPRLELS